MATAADIRNSTGAERFNDPFLLPSSQYIPHNFDDVLDLCKFLASQFPSYTQTTRRTVSHFITDIQFSGEEGDQGERDEVKEYAVETLHSMEILQQAGMESFILGNSFVRMYRPFERYLKDYRGGGYREYDVNMFGDTARFILDTLEYEVPDPLQEDVPVDERRRVRFKFKDRDKRDPSKISFQFVDPKQMILRRNHISGKMEYIYRFEEFFIADVKRGDKIWQVNETPYKMLLAIRDNQDYKFGDGSVFHFANNFISGTSYNGWGIPGILLNYYSIHQVAVLRSINEAVGLDYMLPIRMISPTATAQGGGADAATSFNLGPWMQAMTDVIRNKRKDLTAMHIVPFPVQFQELGGEGKNLAPVELMKYMDDRALEDFGYPAELAHMSLQAQEVPTAIRLFESTFRQLQSQMSHCLQWMINSALAFLGKPAMHCSLAKPTLAADIERKHLLLNLATGGEISRQLAYGEIGVENAVQEKLRRVDEDFEIQRGEAKRQADFEREQNMGSSDQVLQAGMQAQQEAQAQAQGGGGPVPSGGAGGGRTPDKVMRDAEQLAMQWLQMQGQDDRAKNESMEQVRNIDPTLYAVAKQKMEEMRAQGASQGRRMAGKQ